MHSSVLPYSGSTPPQPLLTPPLPLVSFWNCCSRPLYVRHFHGTNGYPGDWYQVVHGERYFHLPSRCVFRLRRIYVFLVSALYGYGFAL